MYYINYFFLYSIIGHAIESIIYLFCSGHSGFLYGYWTPVYGIGIIIVLIIDKFLKKFKLSRFKYLLLLFLISSILLTLIEYLGGILFKSLFNIVLWDYSNHKFNFGKFISLKMVIIWGISSLLFIVFLKGKSDKIVKKIPRIVSWILIILFFIDLLLTIFMKSKIFF